MLTEYGERGREVKDYTALYRQFSNVLIEQAEKVVDETPSMTNKDCGVVPLDSVVHSYRWDIDFNSACQDVFSQERNYSIDHGQRAVIAIGSASIAQIVQRKIFVQVERLGRDLFQTRYSDQLFDTPDDWASAQVRWRSIFDEVATIVLNQEIPEYLAHLAAVSEEAIALLGNFESEERKVYPHALTIKDLGEDLQVDKQTCFAVRECIYMSVMEQCGGYLNDTDLDLITVSHDVHIQRQEEQCDEHTSLLIGHLRRMIEIFDLPFEEFDRTDDISGKTFSFKSDIVFPYIESTVYPHPKDGCSDEHVVLQINDIYIDFTPRQYCPDAPWPYIYKASNLQCPF